MTRFTFSTAIALLFVGFLGAQTDTDDLFTNPEPDTAADTSQTVSLDAFTGQSIRFFESLEVDGYLVTGYRGGEFITTPVNALNFGMGTDVRLDRTARAYASFYLPYPKVKSNDSLYNPYDPPLDIGTVPTELSFENIEVKELFLDYSVGTLAIFRLGRQTATWGQGRLFNPGNLVEGIGNGMAVKLSTAIGPVAVTGVAIKNDSLYKINAQDPKESLGLSSLGTAALVEMNTEWFSTGVSGFYHLNIGAKTDTYVKTSFWGSDFFAEALAEWIPADRTSWTGVLGFYREFGPKPQWLKLQAEALVSGRGDQGSFSTVAAAPQVFDDWTLGLAATTELLSFLSTKPSVLWLHSLKDHSGQVIFGVVNTSLPHIELTMGIARVYGGPTSRYILNNPDPEDRTLALTIKAAFQFDVKS